MTRQEHEPKFHPLFLIDFDGDNKLLFPHVASGGVSNNFSGLENLPKAYRQASLALKYSGELCGRESLTDETNKSDAFALVLFRNRILHCFLGENPIGEELWQSGVYSVALEKLHTYDRQHGTNNLRLLYRYLHDDRKATETSNYFHIHRNSVLYRIGKIEELLNLDLNNYEDRLGLEMSLLYLEIRGFDETADGGRND
jgi:DNA-binding PucR family transcriptional regulator